MKYQSNTVKRIFFWLSGAGTETLENCPNWEQRKYVAFGATVLVPCIFAFIACAYALSTITENPMVIYPVAVVWSFIILTIDRALLASYRPYLSIFRKIGQFLLRFCIAVLLGVTIAHPLVLLLFNDTVISVIENGRANEIKQVRLGFEEEKSKIHEQISRIENAIAGQREIWNETFRAKFILQEREDTDHAVPRLTNEQMKELENTIKEVTAPYTQRLSAVDKQIEKIMPLYNKINNELQFWQSEFEREINGERSGIVGEGPRSRSIFTDQLEPRRVESKRLGGLLEHLTAEKQKLEADIRQAEADAISTSEAKLAEVNQVNREEAKRVAALKQKVEEDLAGAFVAQQNTLRDTIKVQIDSRLKALNRQQDALVSISNEENAMLNKIHTEPRRDILTQTLALHDLFKQNDRGGEFALYTYVILVLLFMLIDTLPLVIKFFTKPGPYDTLLDRDEVAFDSERQAFLDSHNRYMDQLASGNLIAVTRNKKLESELVDSVEHSRAAREFLDSLIELEKAFAEKMKIEQETSENGGPEKRLMLEAMKTGFYDNLHKRMETFFARQAVLSGELQS